MGCISTSSVKLRKLKILLSLILVPEVHRTASAVMPPRGGAQNSLHPIALLLQIYLIRESPCCEDFTIYIIRETTQTKPKKPGLRTCSRLVIVWMRVSASTDLDVQLQRKDRCLQNKGATYCLHSGAMQLSMGFYKNSA